jgi:DNA end-binding protein Ku
MAEIASMIMDKKRVKFDPSKFEDRYEDALAAMIEEKKKGKKQWGRRAVRSGSHP